MSKLTIWKYDLMDERYTGPDVTQRRVPMPFEAAVLTVQMQNGKPHIWALVDPDEKGLEHRKFHIVGTGNDVPVDTGRYVGTWQSDWLVFHLFEAAPRV